MHGWSIKSFDMLFELLSTVFPQINPFPSSWSKCKQLKKDLGLYYEKIHVCLNDCILYWAGRETTKSAISVTLEDGQTRIRNYCIRFYIINPYSEAT